jgi:hypothetical protein
LQSMSIFQPDPDPASEKMDRDPRAYENSTESCSDLNKLISQLKLKKFQRKCIYTRFLTKACFDAQSGLIFCAKNLDPDPEAEFINV